MGARPLFPSKVAEFLGWKPGVLGVYLCREPGWRREVEWRDGEPGSGRPRLRLDSCRVCRQMYHWTWQFCEPVMSFLHFSRFEVRS